ncbi:MAG: 3-isopropylmalate dehydratase large subunit [Rhodospirillaceae bacterium]|nr:3-isopropylmalate dehydratase large subunit [Rhodospirillaceae bacterium]|tara:strand:- start:987 stop:2390 length:1404 start_codon:yes stop_codon:yes gene_type:complete
MGKTLFEKIWDEHVIFEREDGDVLLYIDRHLTHDLHFRTFGALKAAGLSIKEPEKLFGMPDHSVPTTAKVIDDIPRGEMRDAVEVLASAADEMGFVHYPMTDERHGIVHVVGPEQGITLPGLILVCGDSHTSTHGALGCMSFGIGSTEVSHVMATQTLWQRKPKQMRINIDGELGFGVSGKDVILAIIREISAAGGTGYAIEFAGSAIEKMSIEGRMTICNMAIEAGARSGMIAPDEKTIEYCKGRPLSPTGQDWENAEAYWRTLPSDQDAVYDEEVILNGDAIAPMVTWGNSPQWALPITETIPDPMSESDPLVRADMEAALEYMDLKPGMAISDIKIDTVFVGACTNSRIEDMRAAAAVAKGRKAQVRTLIVPGSGIVKKQAEVEGLDKIFVEAGMEWREPGCSMCVAMNGDMLSAGERSASTSNRNFRGRQGLGSRTHLVSPAMATAASVTGHFTDVRKLMEEN